MEQKRTMPRDQVPKQATNTKPIPHIPLPFEEVMKDVLRVKPPEKPTKGRVVRKRKLRPSA
jgi:hypothetical protein